MTPATELTSIWDVKASLGYEQALDPDDPRWVDTAAGRGDFSVGELYRSLGMSIDGDRATLRAAPDRAYVLFCGHRGCGKSTELRRIRGQIHHPDGIHAVLVDTLVKLDINNLRYPDLFLALAEALLEQLPDGVDIDDVHLGRLKQWFDQRVVSNIALVDLTTELEAGVSVEAGVPFFTKLFAKLTSSIKANASYKDEVRRVVRNTFSEFAGAFEHLVEAAEASLVASGGAERIVFLVDGTDRLTGDDSRAFFIEDVHQLKLARGLFVYAAPIHLVHDGNHLNQDFDAIHHLPMIKISTRDGKPFEPGRAALRQMLGLRAPARFFDDRETANLLVETSGGNPRTLMRLVDYTFQKARGDIFDRAAAEAACDKLATDYRRFLEPDDFVLLRSIDADADSAHNSARARDLLYNLALLEYNSFWWASHPVVRRLDGYRNAEPQ